MINLKKYLIIVGVLIILGATVFFLFFNKPSPQLEVVYTSTTPRDVDWEKSLPSVIVALQSKFLGSRLGETSPIRIYKTGDITGDGISEAMVDMGIGNEGTTLSSMKLMMIENNKPVFPEFILYNGYHSKSQLFQVGTVVNSNRDITFFPNKKVIYESIIGTGSNAFCGITAYQWNVETKNFDFSQELTDEIEVEVCK